MKIAITCPGCQTSFLLPHELLGKKIRCKKCQEIFKADTAPSDDDEPEVVEADESDDSEEMSPRPRKKKPAERLKKRKVAEEDEESLEEEDELEEEERPRKKKPFRAKKQAASRMPLVIIGIVLLVVGSLIAAFFIFKDKIPSYSLVRTAPVSNPTAGGWEIVPNRPLPNVAETHPEFSFDVVAWRAEWEKDPVAAKHKYHARVIELHGTVDSVFDFMLYLDAGGTPNSPKLIGCDTSTTEKELLAKVSPGSKIKIKGLPSGSSDVGFLWQCIITDAGTNPAVFISAQDLLKEYAANPEATFEKYNWKYAVVNGMVAGKQDNVLFLEAENDKTLKCGFARADQIQLLAGHQARVYGKLIIPRKPPKNVITNDKSNPLPELRFCLLILK